LSNNNSQNSSIAILLISVLVAVIVIYLSVFSGGDVKPVSSAEQDESGQREGILARIKPVVTLDEIKGISATAPAEKQAAPVAEAALVETAVATKSVEDLYNGACMACHMTGAAGAPRLGNSAEWSTRIAAGYDTMLQNALMGKGAMPPRGASAYSDEEIGSIVQFIIDKSS
jgi:cytochrome c5